LCNGISSTAMARERTFADELRDWLKRHDWVQKQGADALGVSLDTFRSWIHGHRTPTESPSIREVREKMELAK
jgi:transcriptional regulator with XRE-family HTH domain